MTKLTRLTKIDVEVTGNLEHSCSVSCRHIENNIPDYMLEEFDRYRLPVSDIIKQYKLVRCRLFDENLNVDCSLGYPKTSDNNPKLVLDIRRCKKCLLNFGTSKNNGKLLSTERHTYTEHSFNPEFLHNPDIESCYTTTSYNINEIKYLHGDD